MPLSMKPEAASRRCMPVLEALVEVNSLPWPCSAMAWRSRAAPTPWLR
jgi:hypothetical protein